MECISRCQNIAFIEKPLSKKNKKRLKWTGIVLIALAILSLIGVFVIFPIVFMYSIELQRLLVFTNLGLSHDRHNFQQNELRPGLKNFYIPILDASSGANLTLGAWHIVPSSLLNKTLTSDPDFDFSASLNSPDSIILIYFHGTGESRSDSLYKYQVFKEYVHVITFDYRSYADSAKGVLSEANVIQDCLQIYQWVAERSQGSIFLWGHSLGSALAAETALELGRRGLRQPKGLVLEGAFTSFEEEIKVHPIGKIFAWLPYFQQTVLAPLARNGFLFNTKSNILGVKYPIMILSAEDDNIVPFKFGEELCITAKSRNLSSGTYCYRFPYIFRHKHNFIYENQILPLIIRYFIQNCLNFED